MKLRYVIMIAASVGITLGLFWGCVAENNVYSQFENHPALENRMSVLHSIYTRELKGNGSDEPTVRLYIIKVDNKEYIVNSHGGIVEHSK